MRSETINMEIKNIAGDVIYCSPTAKTIKEDDYTEEQLQQYEKLAKYKLTE